MKRIVSLVLTLAFLIALSQSCFAITTQKRPLAIGNEGYNITEEEFVNLVVDVVNGKYPDYSDIAFPTDVVDKSDDTLCLYALTGFNGLDITISMLHAVDNEKFAKNDKDTLFDNVCLIVNLEDDDDYTLAAVYMCAIIYLTNNDISSLSEALEILAELKYDNSVFYQYGPMEYQIAMVGSLMLFDAREIATYKE